MALTDNFVLVLSRMQNLIDLNNLGNDKKELLPQSMISSFLKIISPPGLTSKV
jgi:hypothetical protein